MTINDTITIERTKHPPRVYRQLTPAAVKVLRHYLDIVRESSRNGFHQALDSTVTATSLSKRAIQNANECLRQLDFIRWDRGHNGSRNRYWLNFEHIQQEFGQRVNKVKVEGDGTLMEREEASLLRKKLTEKSFSQVLSL